ncbi:ECF transporter S component [Gudongella sp. DL1XJH-153]|uniref:ECF transporter S component n=1 Tax=Gudongella sp. DL1XJH-153 TaxID=3409804 RepID=UPI003BB717B5
MQNEWIVEDKRYIEHPGIRKRSTISAFIILVLIPLTIWFGMEFLNDRKYYFISMFLVVYTMVPFFMVFENRDPQARELIVISVLAALAVMGRTMFFMLPAFKPMMAIVIISGIAFGPEAGFLVGSMSAFVSNFFFGQGPWTPWQMFALGLTGFLAGVLIRKGILRKTRLSLSIYGFLTTFLIYGGVMNIASVLMYTERANIRMFLASYISGIPYDLVHAISTVFFLYFLSGPMIEKLDRIRIKYGMLR